MMEESVVQLTGDIDIRVDTRPIDRLEHKLRALMRLSDALGRKISKNLTPDGRAMGKLAAQTKQQFAAQMQASKFTLAQQQQQTKLGTLQTKQALEQAKVKKAEQANAVATAAAQRKAQFDQLKAAVTTATAQRKSQLDQLKAHGATLANKTKALRLTDLEARIKARQQRAERNAARAPQAQTRFRNPFHGGGGTGRGGLSGHAGRLANNFGGFGRGNGFARPHMPSGGGARIGAGVGFPALGGLAGAATGAAIALAAMAAVAFKFVSEAERAANAQQQRNAQFKVASGSEEGAKGMEARYQKLSDYLGLNANEGGRDYAKLTGALAKKGGVDQAEKTASGIMSYGKAQGMTQDEMKLMNRGLLQALGKNQLYAEEWTGQISEHLGANANQYGAEAYQRATGGKLTGQAAADQFFKDRKDGKIKGDVLQSFVKELGAVLGQHANDGGALDVARQSQDSRKARFANQMSENLTHAYNNSGLKEATGPMYENAQGLLKALGPEFDKFATWSANSIKMLSQGLKLATDFVDALNSPKPDAMNAYFDPESLKAFKAAWDEFTTSMQDRFKALGDLWHAVFGESTAKGFASGVLDVLTFILKAFTGISNVITSIIKESVAFVQWAKKNIPGLGGETAGQDGKATPAVSHPASKTAPGVSMLAPTQNDTSGKTTPFVEPLVVPKTPSLVTPSLKANMEVMSVPPVSSVSPPVVQPASTTNNTTVNHNVTVQSPNIKVEGSTLTPDEIATALGSKLQGLATKAIEDSFKGAAAQQTNRFN